MRWVTGQVTSRVHGLGISLWTGTGRGIATQRAEWAQRTLQTALVIGDGRASGARGGGEAAAGAQHGCLKPQVHGSSAPLPILGCAPVKAFEFTP